MAKFRYQAFDRSGNLLEGDLDAASDADAREILWQRGVTTIAVAAGEDARPLMQREFKFGKSGEGLSDAQFASLAGDLAILLEADLPLDTALRIVSSNNADAGNREIAGRMLEEVLKGSPLSAVLQRLGGDTHEDCIHIVQAGELSGDLGGALRSMAKLLERRLERRRRIRAALAYPILLICLAAASLWVVIGLLLPSVTPIFADNGIQPPTVIAVLNGVRSYAYELFGAVGGSAAALYLINLAIRRQPELRIGRDRLWLGVPLFGEISRLRDAASFTRTLSALLGSGVPLLQAFEAALMLVGNRHMRSLLEVALMRIREGVTLANAVAENAVLPDLARQMIAVGEETGQLGVMLEHAATSFERLEQSRTDRVIASVTPALTVGIAGLVAVIIISIMGAIMSINDLVMQ